MLAVGQYSVAVAAAGWAAERRGRVIRECQPPSQVVGRRICPQHNIFVVWPGDRGAAVGGHWHGWNSTGGATGRIYAGRCKTRIERREGLGRRRVAATVLFPAEVHSRVALRVPVSPRAIGGRLCRATGFVWLSKCAA